MSHQSVSTMGFDGTSESPRRSSVSKSRPGSEHGGSPRKASGSASPSPSGPSQGASRGQKEEKPLTPAEILGKRVDLPAEAYYETSASESPRFAARPGYNSEGKAIKIELNIFDVTRMPSKDIYQYDVNVSPNENNSRALVKKVWKSNTVQNLLKPAGGVWLYDSNKLAWSSVKLAKGEERAVVDLDVESGKESRGKKVYCTIKYTKTVRMQYLLSYLKGEASWDTSVLECMSFLDHVMRQKPSETLTLIKRNFFSPTAKRIALDILLEVSKGTYAAFRLGDSITRQGTGLTVNVDISNTTFWQPHRLSDVALRLCKTSNPQWKNWDMNRLAPECKPRKQGDVIVMSEAFKALRRLHRLKFVVNHRGKLGEPKIYTVKNLVWDVKKYGAQGATSKTVTFRKKDATQDISLFDYFMTKYQVYMEHEDMPIVETSRGGMFPLEVCNLLDQQRYPFKLDPNQTAAMIKIAVTRPDKRKADIMAGVRDLNWDDDKYLRAFDIPIKGNMVQTNARLLTNPQITYANKKENPGVSGRWDLRGKQFWEANINTPLRSWGMAVIGDACEKQHIEAFASQFSTIYRGHGGKIEKAPVLLQVPFSVGDYGKIVEYAYKNIGMKNKEHPAIIFFVIGTKNQLIYERIKKNMDCRWCVVSQVLQGMHVKKNQAQYCSNVAMKVNAKLGGITCKIAGPTKDTPPFFKVPTMIIGLDITHASPGSGQASMAAMTISTDKHACRYAATCEVNSWRQEILVHTHVKPLFDKNLEYWCKLQRCSPKHVYFFRDGVGDGQFQEVISSEVKDLKRCFRDRNLPEPKFTVIVATKRHHIRFFPKQNDRSAADRNANPLPGTLVERDATHPFHFDFYLCSHSAIQGTARPVHYNVIYDEFGVNVNLLQKMIYEQCYQYCRSTTPVSLHPAVYYSHLASQRARAHEDIASSQKEMVPIGKEGFPVGKTASEVYSNPGGKPQAEPKPLLQMNNNAATQAQQDTINRTMWYV